MNRLTEHISNSITRYSVNPSQFKSGMIIDTFYKDRFKDKQRYYFLILHPKWPSNSQQCHAIKLNEISKFQFLKLADKLGLECIDNYHNINLSSLNLTTNIANAFYMTEIKNSVIYKPNYRTLLWSGFNNTYMVDYNFGAKIKARYPCK